jgi:large subunit ribosomal protein L9
MEIVLLEKVQNLGEIGDVVKVRPGYARNYLFPTGKAAVATAENKAELEARRKELEAAEAERLTEARRRAACWRTRASDRPQGGRTGGRQAVRLRHRRGYRGRGQPGDRGRGAREGGNQSGRRPVQGRRGIEISVFLHPEVHIEIKVNVIPEEGGE